MSETANAGFFSHLPERIKEETTLPSGSVVTVLETTGREEKILSGVQDTSKIPQVMRQYLAGISEGLSEEDCDKLLVGDRMYILIKSRILTYGRTFEYKMNCTSCDSYSEHELDLQTILDKCKPYPGGDSREFSVDIDGGTIWFTLPDGKSEIKIAKMKEIDINAKLRAIRVWEKTPKGDMPINIDMLRSRHIAELRKAVKSHECDLDTVAEFKCPTCGHVEKVEVIGLPDFLYPNLV